jgi:hypothetical protein
LHIASKKEHLLGYRFPQAISCFDADTLSCCYRIRNKSDIVISAISNKLIQANLKQLAFGSNNSQRTGVVSMFTKTVRMSMDRCRHSGGIKGGATSVPQPLGREVCCLMEDSND